MIISFNGDHGSGKSTIAKKLAEKLDYPRIYIGQILRDMASQRGMTLVELLKLGETDPSIDKEVDDYMINVSREKDNLIIESRTAWHLVPQSLKIYLRVDEVEGAKRIYGQLQQSNSRNEDKKLDTLEDLIDSSRRRRASDNLRYEKYYGINIENMDNYDLVLDTTDLSIEEVFQKVLDFVSQN